MIGDVPRCWLLDIDPPDFVPLPLKHQDTVTVGETVVGRDKDGRNVEKRHVQDVPYKQWEGRCKACYPSEQ